MRTHLHPNLLADTWWYGLSHRLTEESFQVLATLRASQGFSAAQLVVGIPPEIGPQNPNARSVAGFPWSVDGKFNLEYVKLAAERVKILNRAGLVAIVYGAWGYQIDWLGVARMEAWWRLLVDHLDEFDVVYCLCGESNLGIGGAHHLLPDRSTDDRRVGSPRTRPWHRFLDRRRSRQRRRDWSRVLETLSGMTSRAILLHPVWQETAFEAVDNPELLAANTAQTGHDAAARHRIWQLPLRTRNTWKEDATRNANTCAYLNLEPWYEGILGQFGTQDQLFAYWVSMLAGATGHCYGAHGIWNVGDGSFLAHWGKQTFDQGARLDTPRLLGLSHREFVTHCAAQDDWELQLETERDDLKSIGRSSAVGGRNVVFFPDVAKVESIPSGRAWSPMQGTYARHLPSTGPLVVFACDDRAGT